MPSIYFPSTLFKSSFHFDDRFFISADMDEKKLNRTGICVGVLGVGGILGSGGISVGGGVGMGVGEVRSE